MATTKISTGVLKDGSVTSAKLDTNISIVGDLTVDTNTLFVDSASNRVGIGTSSPSVPLHIYSNNGAVGRFANNSATLATTYLTVINANNTSNGTVIAHIDDGTSYIGNQQNNALRFVTNDTERMRITSTGNVGIGTASPNGRTEIVSSATGDTLALQLSNSAGAGNDSVSIRFRNSTVSTSTSGGSEITGLRDAANNGGSLILKTSASAGFLAERMRIDSSGRVGIGTSDPSANLDVNLSAQFNKSSTDGGFVNILGNNSYIAIGADKGGGATLKYNSNGNLDITPRIGFNTVFTRGNVGIGTSIPVNIPAYTTLDIRNNLNGSILYIGKNGTDSLRLIGESANAYVDNMSTTGDLLFRTNNATERMRIELGGAVVLKTSDSRLRGGDTAGRLIISNSNTTSWISLNGSANTNAYEIAFITNSANAMKIGSSGNVTIGDAAASAKLNIIPSSDGSVSPFLQFIRTGTASQYASQFVTSGTEVGSIKTTNTTTSYNTSSTSGLIGVDANTLGFKTNSAERMRLEADGDLHVDGDVIAYSTTISDQRLKDDVQTIDNALDKVCNLRGVSYTWNNGSRKGQKDLGLIAQEVEQVLPELVREKEMPMIDGGTYKTVDYEKIVGVLIEAVKELKAEIESLKSK
jgi:hypothetical protein